MGKYIFRTRWNKLRSSDKKFGRIDEENEELSMEFVKIFEKIITMDMKIEGLIEKSGKLFNLTKLVRCFRQKDICLTHFQEIH